MPRAKGVATGDARHRVLDEAARQLNARGISLASLTAIAKTLRISRPALYNHIKDREDLVYQCYRRSCEILSRHLDGAILAGGQALQVVEGFIDRVLDPEAPEIAALSEIDYLEPGRRLEVSELLSRIVGQLRDVLEQGALRGEVRTCDFGIAANAIIGLIQWVQLAPRWSIEMEPVARDRLRPAARGLLFDGLAMDRRRPLGAQSVDLSSLEPKLFQAFDRQPLAEAKRELILATASRLFNLKGVDVVSLDEIAARLGATKRTVYHHVGDKQALIAACYLRAYRIFLFIAAQAHDVSAPRLDVLAGAFQALVTANLTADLSPLLPSAGIEVLRADDRPAVTAQSAALFSAYERLFAEGRADHSVREVDLAATLLCLPGALVWVGKIAGQVEDSERGRLAREIATLLCLGLRPIHGLADG